MGLKFLIKWIMVAVFFATSIYLAGKSPSRWKFYQTENSVDIIEVPAIDGKVYVTSRTPYTRLFKPDEEKVSSKLSVIDTDGFISNAFNGDINHPTALAEVPSDPSTLLAGSYTDGVYVVRDGQLKGFLNENNTPLVKWWGTSGEDIVFDENGNLWCVAGYDVEPMLMMLPASKTADIVNVKKGDWKICNTNGRRIQLDGKITAKGSLVAVTSSDYHSPVVLYNVEKDLSSELSSFALEDGTDFVPDYIYDSAVAFDGSLWLATSEGPVIITDPLGNAPDAIRPPDSSLSSYLLEGVKTTAIVSDDNHQMWLATSDDGLYCINTDTYDVMNHYTTENSPLPCNEIRAVVYDSKSGKLYAGTENGIGVYDVSYNGNINPSEIKVFPNPVRPDYGGGVTIEGVPEGTLVEICDATGRVLWSRRGDGNKMMWNPSSASSGIYYAFGSNEKDKALISKILIIK